MANDISGRQWLLDTPLAFGNAGSVLWKGNVKVAHFEFSKYAAQGNKAIIKDQNGKVVWSVTGSADLSEIRSSKVGWVNGLCLDTLDSGVVIVYTE